MSVLVLVSFTCTRLGMADYDRRTRTSNECTALLPLLSCSIAYLFLRLRPGTFFCFLHRRRKNKAGVSELGAGGQRADLSFGIGIDELSGESRYRLALGKVGGKSPSGPGAAVRTS